jgi:hypothetical protein
MRDRLHEHAEEGLAAAMEMFHSRIGDNQALQEIARRGYRAARLIEAELAALEDPFDNYQRQALRDAMVSINAIGFGLRIALLRRFANSAQDPSPAVVLLIQQYMAAAVQSLGDGIDHAHRPGYTETRREVGVCIEAFNILTTKGAAA